MSLKIDEVLSEFKESKLLNLHFDRAYHDLGWKPVWGIEKTIKYTSEWYKKFNQGITATKCCEDDLKNFLNL